MTIQPNLIFAHSPEDYQQARTLFEEYARTLSIDLGFQGFASELVQIAQQYQATDGGIVLLMLDNEAIACAGLRRIDAHIAELKRMYIRPAFRGQGLGKLVLNAIIKLAQSLDYQYIRLDTLASMTEAIGLYEAFGFYEIAPYRYNPLPDAKYMELKL
ncbi:MAG: GNAT family N-acetyltransferase [Microscillaceae bacterium]|jgi:ribosomal protein S18 acetylase RimI-like enzyme|nr:GNAT family N-acetyltransferase [Microscillaceae bacterium]